MKETGITLSGPMARAILSGEKVQMRRVLEWQTYEPGYNVHFSGASLGHYIEPNPKSGWVLRSRGHGGCWNDRTKPTHCPLGEPGDRLWVREIWAPHDSGVVSWRDRSGVYYRADDEKEHEGDGDWCPASRMPKWAARIWLEITNVSVRFLQPISESDALAEGVRELTYGEMAWPTPDGGFTRDPKVAFEIEWDRANTKRGHKWKDNPWVWLTHFKRIDDVRATVPAQAANS